MAAWQRVLLGVLTFAFLASGAGALVADWQWGFEEHLAVNGSALTIERDGYVRGDRVQVGANDTVHVTYRVVNDRPLAWSGVLRIAATPFGAGGDALAEARVHLGSGEAGAVNASFTPRDLGFDASGRIDRGGNGIRVDVDGPAGERGFVVVVRGSADA